VVQLLQSMCLQKGIRPTLHTDSFVSKWLNKRYTIPESMQTDSSVQSVLFLFQEQGCCGSRWWAPSCCGCRPQPALRGTCNKDTVSLIGILRHWANHWVVRGSIQGRNKWFFASEKLSNYLRSSMENGRAPSSGVMRLGRDNDRLPQPGFGLKWVERYLYFPIGFMKRTMANFNSTLFQRKDRVIKCTRKRTLQCSWRGYSILHDHPS